MASISQITEVLGRSTEQSERKFHEFPWRSLEHYSWWLSQTYFMVRHTTRFLCLLGGTFEFDRHDFHQFSLRHLREEQGHELLAEKDLEHLQKTIGSYYELASTKQSLQSQYYWLDRSAVAHFGFFLYLESLSNIVGSFVMNQASQAFGKKSVSFLKLHVEEDERHVEIILEQLEKATETEKSLVIENIVDSSKLYCEMLAEINATCEARRVA